MKRIVLTGCTRGLGLAMTEGFIAAGHTVCGCGTSRSALDRLQQRFEPPQTFSHVDVTSDAAVAEWAAGVLAAGDVDLLVNNAALINRNAKLWEIAADEFDRLLAVNVSGVANVIRHFVPAMVRRQRGVIVNFSSGWGRSVSADVAPYCASKWAIEGLTQALAEELPAGMAAIPLNPGIINTEMLQSCFAAGAAAYPSPDVWAKAAVPQILGFTAKDNGRPATIEL